MAKVKANILIVDDNEEVLIALQLFFSKHIENVLVEKNPNRIPELLNMHDFDTIILDMNFTAGINTGNEGIYWMKEILKIDKTATIIFLTAYGDLELAVKAIKEGATDFIQKPWDNEKMLATVLAGIKLRKSHKKIDNLTTKQKHLTENLNETFDFNKGHSEEMQQVLKTINKVAKTEANILILGENGVGKELVAREIHKNSERSNEVFVKVDLGSLTETLFESELFGHVKGAFTDAKSSKAGRFEIANGGTLFLDEIGNLSLAMQAKLLSVIQNREIVPVGAIKAIPIDTRIISATNSNLIELVSDNQFREDLLYRINTIKIEVPPLRNRREDISVLAEFFLNKYCKKYKKEPFKIYPSAINKLLSYHWPGNVRELEHSIEKAVILANKDVLSPDDFDFDVFFNPKHEIETYNLEENEKKLIVSALKEFNNNLSMVATKLGVTRSTLYRKIDKYEI
jgi:DNA-binding NtrC family response regulator